MSAREQIDRGLANIEKTYADAVKRGLMSEEKAKEGRARIVASTAPMEMRDVANRDRGRLRKARDQEEDLRAIWRGGRPEKRSSPRILRRFPISELAAATGLARARDWAAFLQSGQPDETGRGGGREANSGETRDRALAFTRQIAKLPVVVQDSPGFLVNRVLFPYLLDAAEMFELGVDAKEIDDALVAWGMPMGPLRLIDEIGVDITVDIADTLEKAFGRRDRAAAVLRWMREGKMLGRKTGSGFYKYEGKAQTPNESLQEWRQRVARRCGRRRPTSKRHCRQRSADDHDARLIFLMVNEAARCLEEKVVATPEDADYGMMMGTGFAPFRGGPLRFAENFGLKKMVEEMERLARAGEKFAPCDF